MLAEAMWRIGAQLELDIEAEEAKVPVVAAEDHRVLCLVHAERPPVLNCGCAVCTQVRLMAATGV